jgi:chemotaxis protein histidine kinase CheA
MIRIADCSAWLLIRGKKAMAGSGDAYDPAMMELFRAELDTHLPVLSEGLLALEKDGGQPRLLEAMMRAAHSIKGAARIVGVEAAVRIAHVLEDCLVAAQKGQIRLGADAIDVLLRGVDGLTRVCQLSADAPEEQSIREMVQAITAVQKGEAAPKAERENRQAASSPKAQAAETAVLRPGNLDREHSERLRRQLLELRDGGARHFRLDFSEVRDVDPAALALLALFARAPGPGGTPPRLEVVNEPPAVRRLLRLTRLDACLLAPPGQGS